MTNKTVRRQFLKTGGLAAAGAFSLSRGLTQETKPAAEGTRAQPASAEFAAQEPRLLPGCCAYSFGNSLSKGKMTYAEFFDEVVKMGSLGADMTVYWFKSTDPAYLTSLRRLAFKKGIPFSGVACGAFMVKGSPARRSEELAEIKKWIDVTDLLGASHLRVFGGRLPHGATVAQGVDWIVETMKAACDYAGKKGITLGIEDDEGVAQTADVCVEIMHRVDSPYAGINLDITNFKTTPGNDAYAQIKACVPYATHVHIRDHFPDGTPVDMDRVWRLVAEAGYKGFMSAEWYGKGNDLIEVPKLMNEIKVLCDKYSTVL